MPFVGTAELKALEDRLLEIEIKYIAPHSNPTASPSAYLLDLQSYAILAHAAFEEYIELICKKVAEETFVLFKTAHKLSFTTICMLHFIDRSDSPKNWTDFDRIYSRLLTCLGEARNKLSKLADDNNGMNLNYLKNLLIPVGLEIPHTVKEIGSFDKLARYRGDFAHRSTIALSVIPTPSDVVNVVEDVLGYMNSLDKQARSIEYFKFTPIN